MSKLPVTIITGFLGAGKTSLLNELINSNPEKRFAIIENEFGEINIDSDLVVRLEEGIFELSNGCICCSMNAELVEMLRKLVGQKAKFDHLLIETTGIAEPGEVVGAFLADPNFSSHFKMDGVICLADAVSLPEILEDRDEARRQIIYADLVLVNKCDEVEAEHLDKIEELVQSINPFALTLRSQFAKVEQEINLLELNAFDPVKLEQQLNRERNHAPHSDVVSHSFVLDQALDPMKFGHWVNVLTLVQGQSFYRIKGFVDYPFRDTRVIFQSVGKRNVFSSGSKWAEGELRQSKLVFIGKKLRRDILEKGLRNCLWVNPFED